MRIIPFSEETLKESMVILHSGGVIAHATETCYGFACDLTNIDAVEKLFRIKQRPTDQSVSALFASVDDAKKYVIWNDRAQELAEKYLPGPLTIILPMRTDAPSRLFPNLNPGLTLGIRISSHPHAQQLIVAFGSPLSTTSANLHGQKNPYSAEDIVTQFKDAEHQPDLILDSGILPPTPPSTVIDCTSEKPTKKRQGDLAV